MDAMSRAELIEVTATGVRLSEAGLPVADGVAAEFLAAAGT